MQSLANPFHVQQPPTGEHVMSIPVPVADPFVTVVVTKHPPLRAGYPDRYRVEATHGLTGRVFTHAEVRDTANEACTHATIVAAEVRAWLNAQGVQA